MTTHSVRNKNEAIVNREFKSTVFTMLYSDRKELLGLYNAVNGTSYSDPSQLEVNTLEHAIYIGMKNDLSFLIDSRLYLYEHQSTFNPNLPLRFLMYIADLYSTLTRDKNLYGTKAVKIPSPKFLIFYNGEKEQPDFQTMKLSQLFSVKEEHPALELEAVMININLGHNQKLMDTCKSLGDYAKYVDRVRKYTKNMELAQAVERAVTECIREGILAATNMMPRNISGRRKKRAGKRVFRMGRRKASGMEKGKAFKMERRKVFKMEKGKAFKMARNCL